MHRYSPEQILYGLTKIIAENSAAPPEPNEPIHEHIGRAGFVDEDEDGELSMFRLSCEHLFGSEIDAGEWGEFFRFDLFRSDSEEWLRTVGLRVTYEALAAWLAERLPAVSFGPVDVAGVRCPKAGAFLGLRDLAGTAGDSVPRFAPSTPIRGCLRRPDLYVLWFRLRWLSRDGLPPLRTRWVNRAAGLFVASVLIGLAGLVASLGLKEAAFVIYAVSLCKLSWTLWSLAERFENPLPEGIVTFGDLAGRLAEDLARRT